MLFLSHMNLDLTATAFFGKHFAPTAEMDSFLTQGKLTENGAKYAGKDNKHQLCPVNRKTQYIVVMVWLKKEN